MKPSLTTPALRRRLLCMVYEAMLLFGIVFSVGFVFDVLSQSHNALALRHARQICLFVVIGAYFVFCWSRSGQTLAMQTWRIRVTDLDGSRLPLPKAVLRYLLAWLWFVPALALAYQFELQGWNMVIALALGMLAWAMTVRMSPDGQFLHDRLAKTRLTEVAVKNNSLTS
ncbi:MULTISPECIES: RDD family protein [unclassified Undibacterium]|uniref:RDD family protein n=1 Tax=unclassified Undibacterium TaxID=2630295 RepID=UPI002AC914B4|nr:MULTISPECIES: RDD family protein [unclassified Undibacterium]MEB0140044.1 RDD family protein [Undibacterium sp. CCC2.1]MEB0173043.1 RDD family protein [Undibacterium sp. CCC1.1]MEB0176855.1 RDD family protein [Undibacterium sp. CCC3.4]MEB0216087.1 RDD family protein [Undibacterium sp. 5I2]WPX42029.1 RDD family protein [Undibacterium sp. CCC3.4]